MMRQVHSYAVTVAVSRNPMNGAERSREGAIAEAARYLSYADQTDTVGYHGDLSGVTVSTDADGDYEIGIQVNVPYSRQQQLDRFEEEMDVLSRVSSVEQI